MNMISLKQIRSLLNGVLISLVLSATLLPLKAQEKGGNCLWKLTTEQNTVYLLGSVHFLKETDYPLDQSIEDAFTESDKLLLEMHLDSAMTPAAQQFVLSKSMLGSGQSLQDILSDSVYGKADKKLNEMGMTMAQFRAFKPWFVTVSLMALKLQSLGYNSELGIDRYFFKKAKDHEMDIMGLETIEYQIGLFDALSSNEQEYLILQTIDELDVFENEIGKLVDSWSKGNTDLLEEILLKSFNEFPVIYEKFIVERNRNWIPLIESAIVSGERTMVIVGAGHLVGEDGVITLLRKRGYRIEQL